MLTDTEPFVRYAAKSTYFIDNMLIARDCRILFIISGKGSFELLSGTHPLLPGTLVYYPAGTPYHIRATSEMLFYTVNFDFTSEMRTEKRAFVPNVYRPNTPIEAISCGIPIVFREPIVIRHGEFAETELKKIYSESLRSQPCAEPASSAYMKLLLINIYRNAAITSEQPSLNMRIKDCVANDLTLNNIQIAERLSYHPYYLNEVFKKSEGISLHQYIMRERLARAKDLITATNRSFESIAQECGFSSDSHLSRSINREYGITPSKMRKL